jgi:LCP family protein required for cell wall assembly
MDKTRPMVNNSALDETRPMLHNPALDETRPMVYNPALDETKPMLYNPSIDDSRPMLVQPNLQQNPVQCPPEEEPMAHYQPILVPRSEPSSRASGRRSGCSGAFLILILPILFVLMLYFFFPLRTNILLLGIDRAPEGTDVSRTDTNIILSVIPLKPVVNMLSIPRDLWVPLANVGENRINTAHFFAEAEKKGSGPAAAMQAVRDNFGINLRYYVRIRFDGFEQVIDAMGGVTLDIATPQAGYDPGSYHLNGAEALTFARNRSSSDDFFRMQRGQMVIIAAVKQMLNPLTWFRIPSILGAVLNSVDTNIPLLEMPRIGLALVRGIVQNTLDARTITREMVFPTTTSGGANVLLPNWEAINPVLMELFGQ